MLTDRLNRVPIAHLPTPIEPMNRLSAFLGGPRLWVKRDDQTGLATGGNKTRKLEFLVGEALAGRADVLVTAGGPQSNHARQTAAAAAKFGLRAVLVLGGEEPPVRTGNLLIDDLLGAEIRWAGTNDPAQMLQKTAEELWNEGSKPALIPYGGSNPVGASGYVAAMEEMMEQMKNEKVDAIVFATSSGGTQSGLVLGARALGFTGRILGISVNRPQQEVVSTVASLANETAAFLNLPYTFKESEIEVTDQYLGGGYAVINDQVREAVRMFARYEGLLVDPVYTGKAAMGLIDLVMQKTFGPNETVLFWHTGGTGGLFGFGEQL
ncbi:MAG: D-cysteine desulfhydrase family protein [Anaerolineales bacterium]|nr:D-cysteine desulfhydrase family protein [Anaerolineales bacterium]